MTRCAHLSRAAAEPMPGSAPRADVWVVVEHPGPWGDADLTRTAHGVRVLMARRPRTGGTSDTARAMDAGTVSAGVDRAPGVRGGPIGADATVGADSSAGDGPDSGRLTPSGPAGARPTRRTPGVRVWIAHAGRDPVLRVGTVADPADVADWDLAGIAAGSHREWGIPDPDPLLLVCANGRRDRCCGHDGRRLAEQLGAGPWGPNVLTSTHLGGHRFAPTALLLPAGALHGRLDAEAAAEVLAQAGRGRTPTATLRGFSTLSEPEQVAEVHTRQRLGHEGLAPLPVRLDRTPDPDHLQAGVTAPDGTRIVVALVRARQSTVASCGRAPEPMARWTVAP